MYIYVEWVGWFIKIFLCNEAQRDFFLKDTKQQELCFCDSKSFSVFSEKVASLCRTLSVANWDHLKVKGLSFTSKIRIAHLKRRYEFIGHFKVKKTGSNYITFDILRDYKLIFFYSSTNFSIFNFVQRGTRHRNIYTHIHYWLLPCVWPES